MAISHVSPCRGFRLISRLRRHSLPPLAYILTSRSSIKFLYISGMSSRRFHGCAGIAPDDVAFRASFLSLRQPPLPASDAPFLFRRFSRNSDCRLFGGAGGLCRGPRAKALLGHAAAAATRHALSAYSHQGPGTLSPPKLSISQDAYFITISVILGLAYASSKASAPPSPPRRGSRGSRQVALAPFRGDARYRRPMPRDAGARCFLAMPDECRHAHVACATSRQCSSTTSKSALWVGPTATAP